MKTIRINTNQLNNLKSTYKTKYVDNSDLYKSKGYSNKVNQSLNKIKIIDIIEYYGELIRKFSQYIKREKPIGYGEDKSPIQLYTIDKTKTEKPIILIVGGVHGDEKTSVYGIYETAKILLESNKWSRFITSNFVIKIIPCLNVYGFNNNQRNNSNNKDLNRDFLKTTQNETKALTKYIKQNKDKIKIILDSHNAYNEEFVSCKQEMKYFDEYEDVAFKLNLFLNGKYETNNKRTYLWISRSKNDGTLSDFINKNKFIGHTVESPRSLVKEIHYPNPINYEDGAEVTVDLLINLMYIYGKMFNENLLTEGKTININEDDIDELQAFHGSHAVFDKFNHKKFLGSGAGSQSFGWGTYVTDDIQIAKDYAELETENYSSISYEGKTISKPELKRKVVNVCKEDFSELFNGKAVGVIPDIYKVVDSLSLTFTMYDKEEYQNAYNFVNTTFNYHKEDIYKYLPDLIENIVYLIFCIHDVQFNYQAEPNKIRYEVDIPDENNGNYLEWYETLNDSQTDKICDGIERLRKRYYGKFRRRRLLNIMLTVFDKRGVRYEIFRDIYYWLTKKFGSQKGASMFLQYCGFDGIKYPTYTRYNKPNGRDGNHHNYVIFDANKVKITKREDLGNNETV